jgi:hypothetical protein
MQRAMWRGSSSLLAAKHLDIRAVRAVGSARTFDEDVAIGVGFTTGPSFNLGVMKR